MQIESNNMADSNEPGVDPPRPFAAWGSCRFFILAAFLCAFIFFFYRDSLAHIHRGDQVVFLEDTMECQSLPETVRKNYSYCRSRLVSAGDVILFRPVLFVFLSLELALFEARRTTLWQLTALIVHGAATILLFAVLLRLSRPWDRAGLFAARPWKEYLLPFSLSAFFSINCSTLEQVIWSHLTGYVLFAVFLLSSFWFLLVLTQAPDDRPVLRRVALIGCWITTALAALTYELGAVYSLALAVLMPFVRPCPGRTKIQVALMFFLIPFGYCAWDWLDWVQRQDYLEALEESLGSGQVVQVFGEDKSALFHGGLFSIHTLDCCWRYFNYALVQPYFPGAAFELGHYVRYQEQSPADLYARLLRWDPMSLIGTIVFASWWVFSALGLLMVWKKRARIRWSLVCLAGTCCAAHMGLIVLGRMTARFETRGSLASGSYFPYLTLLTFLIAVFPFFSLGLQILTPGCRLFSFSNLLPVLFLLKAAQHGIIIMAVNADQARQFKNDHDVIHSLSELVAAKGNDGSYRFGVDYLHSEATDLSRHIPIVTICFHRWIDQSDPIDVITFAGGVLQVRPFAEVRPKDVPPPYYPEFLTLDDHYVYWGLRGKVIGKMHRPMAQKDQMIIEDATLEGALAQRRKKLGR